MSVIIEVPLTKNPETLIKFMGDFGFNLEYNKFGTTTVSGVDPFMRFRHRDAPKAAKFAVIIYEDDDNISIYAKIHNALIDYGKHLKVKEFKKVFGDEEN